MSVLEYVQAFIRLSQYSPEDVDTDPHRATRLLDGFDSTLLTHLGRSYDSFTQLVDAAIDMEDRLSRAHEDQRKKKTCKHASVKFISMTTGCASRTAAHVLHRHAPTARATVGYTTTPIILQCTTSSTCFSATFQTKRWLPLLNLREGWTFQSHMSHVLEDSGLSAYG